MLAGGCGPYEEPPSEEEAPEPEAPEEDHAPPEQAEQVDEPPAAAAQDPSSFRRRGRKQAEPARAPFF